MLGGGTVKKLTLKQKAFADYYIELGNATEAYIRAGYSATKRYVAEANARRLLANYSVKNYINERMKQIEDARIADAKEVLQYLTSVLRGEIKEEVIVNLPRPRRFDDPEFVAIRDYVTESIRWW